MTSTSNLSMHGDEVMPVPVMTEEQIGVLRRQIAAYATICEQLVEMHKVLTAHRDTLNGTRLGNLYSDPLSTSGPHRTTGRQRWSPTVRQLQILEKIFEQDNGAPSKKKIKEITSELSHHGKISETNVYNWFQNRRARSKRKQTAASSNTESEVEAEYESPDNKKRKSDTLHLHEDWSPRIEENSQNLELSEMHCEESQTRHPSSRNSKYSGSPNDLTPRSMNQPVGGSNGLARGAGWGWSGGI